MVLWSELEEIGEVMWGKVEQRRSIESMVRKLPKKSGCNFDRSLNIIRSEKIKRKRQS